MLSVVVTTKNEAANIAACLRSFDGFDDERIVVDNGSTDDTKKIAAELGAIVLDKGPERSAQRNLGWRTAKNDWVVILDADMILPKETVEEIISLVSQPQPSTSTLKTAIWATGDWYAKACAVAARTGGVAVHARYLKPFDANLLAEQRAAGLGIVSLENGAVTGGFGEAIGADVRFGWPDEFIPHGTQAELERDFGLDEDSLVAALTQRLNLKS